MLNYLSLLGWNDGSEQEIYSVGELQQAFSLERITKSAAGARRAAGLRWPAERCWLGRGHLRWPLAGASRGWSSVLNALSRPPGPPPDPNQTRLTLHPSPTPTPTPAAPPPVFDKTKLAWMNGQHLRALPEEELRAEVGARWVASGLLKTADGPFAAAALALVQNSLELVRGGAGAGAGGAQGVWACTGGRWSWRRPAAGPAVEALPASPSLPPTH